MKRAVSAVRPSRSRKKRLDATRQARGPLALLEQLAEDGDERGRERGVRDERPHEVRNLEGDREGVDRALDAEVAGGRRSRGRARECARDPWPARRSRSSGRDDGDAPAPPAPADGHSVPATASEYRSRRRGRAQAPVIDLPASIVRPRRARALLRHAEHQATGTTSPYRRPAAAREPSLALGAKTQYKRLVFAVEDGDEAAIADEHKLLVRALDRAAA